MNPQKSPGSRCDLRHLTVPMHKVMTVQFRGHIDFFEVVLDDIVVFSSQDHAEARLALQEAYELISAAKRFHGKI